MLDTPLLSTLKSRMRDMARSNNVLVGEMSWVLALALVESVAVDLEPSPAVSANVQSLNTVPLTPSPSPQPHPEPRSSSSSQLSEQTIVILSISLVAVLALAVLFCLIFGKRCMRRCCVCCYDEDEEPLVKSRVP